MAEQEKGREYHLTVVGCDGWVNGEGVNIEPERVFFGPAQFFLPSWETLIASILDGDVNPER